MDSRRDVWQVALRRAGMLAGRVILPDHGNWDWLAVRGLVAIALAGCAGRDHCSPDDVELTPLFSVFALGDPTGLRGLADIAVAADSRPAGGLHDESPASYWQWLNRRWDPDARPRWDGLTRGIARGLPDAAVDVCLGWARGAVLAGIAIERNALPRGTKVRITGGQWAGCQGSIRGFAGRMDQAGVLAPDDPVQYQIMIETADPGWHLDVVPRTDFTVIS